MSPKYNQPDNRNNTLTKSKNVIKKPDIFDNNIIKAELPTIFMYRFIDKKYTTIKPDNIAPTLSKIDS
jgi:hypothetical protein